MPQRPFGCVPIPPSERLGSWLSRAGMSSLRAWVGTGPTLSISTNCFLIERHRPWILVLPFDITSLSSDRSEFYNSIAAPPPRIAMCDACDVSVR